MHLACNKSNHVVGVAAAWQPHDSLSLCQLRSVLGAVIGCLEAMPLQRQQHAHKHNDKIKTSNNFHCQSGASASASVALREAPLALAWRLTGA